jgi:Family of unknown function (DUF6600)
LIAGEHDLLELLRMAPGGEAVRLLLISIFSTILAVPALAEEAAMPAATPIPNAEATAPAAEAPPGRVGRLSLVSGNVSVRAAKEWLDAVLNVPVATGASLRTGAQARAEIEIGADTIELAPESEIEITKLDDRTIQVAVVGGRIGFDLRQLGDGEGVEVEVSNEGVPLLQPGCYDIDVSSRRIAVSAGDALSAGTSPTGAMIEPAARDDFIEWCRSRDYDETRLAAPYYVSPYMTGFAGLDAAGTWESTAEYGAVWVPTGLPFDWAPYRDGHWRWIAPWGWTWIDDQPWGFAPSHYGRWAFVGKRWVWVPGGFVEHPEYMPAVVAFLGTRGVGLSVADSTGPGIGWFPLAPGEAYWPSYGRDPVYVRSLNQGDVSDLETIRLDANGEPPLEVFDGHFANRRFASVVPRPVFVNGGAVAPALLALPEQRLQDAPVLMGSPQVGPPVPRVAVAAPAIARPGRAQWANHIAALVARSVSRAKALQTAFMHRGDADRAPRLRGAHLRAPAYAQSAPPRHTILLRVAHAAVAPARGGAGKGSRH